MSIPSAEGRRAFVHQLFWITLVAFPVSLSGSGDVRLAQIALHLAMGAFIVFSAAVVLFDTKICLPRACMAKYVIFLGSVLAYFCLLTATNEYAGSFSDVLDVSRPLVYFMYFLVPFLFPLNEEQVANVLRTLTALAIATVVFSAFVYVPALWPTVDVYKGRTSTDAVVFHFFRWSGTSGYPADYSFFLSFFIYLLLAARKPLYGPTKDLLLLIVISVGAAMTMSRGGIASIGATVLVGGLLLRKTKELAVFGFFGAVMVAALLWLAAELDASILNLNYVWDLISSASPADASAEHRVNELSLAGEYSLKYFPFGLGAARDVIESELRVVESLYGHYLIKWGVIGLIFFVIATAYLLRCAVFVLKRSSNEFIAALACGFIMLTLSVTLVFGLSSAIVDRFKGLPLYFVMSGYLAYWYETWRISSANDDKRLNEAAHSHATGS